MITGTTLGAQVEMYSPPSAGSSGASVTIRSAPVQAPASSSSAGVGSSGSDRSGPAGSTSPSAGTATVRTAPSVVTSYTPGRSAPASRAAGAPGHRSASTTRVP